MEMTISAVQLGASSQPQAKASDSGFSDVLTEVRTASPQVQDNAVQYTSEQPSEQPVQTETAENTVGVQVLTENISVEFEETVVQLISKASGGTKEETDRIIDALLEILKKMKNDSDEDPSINLVMELLASMMGETENTPMFDFRIAATETSVTAVSTEITAILSAESESAETAPQLPVQNNENIQNTENIQNAEIPQNPEAPVLQADAQPADLHTAASNETVEITAADAQPEMSDFTVKPDGVQAKPAEGYEKLLNDILSEARKELNLTKAEFKPVQEPVPTKTDIRPQTETVTGTVRPFTHKDGTDELNSILGVTTEEAPDKQQEIKPAPVIQDTSAALTGNVPQKTEVVANETEVRVEAPLPEQQLADEILSKPETLNGGRTEFTMELNPESLGKITVRLVSTEGRVEVNITAENDATRQLLEARAENIGTALRNNGVELERYQVVSGQEEAQLMQENYDGSSKNPYGRNDEEQQQEENGDDFLEILQQL